MIQSPIHKDCHLNELNKSMNQLFNHPFTRTVIWTNWMNLVSQWFIHPFIRTVIWTIWTNLWINDSITYSRGQSFEQIYESMIQSPIHKDSHLNELNESSESMIQSPIHKDSHLNELNESSESMIHSPIHKDSHLNDLNKSMNQWFNHLFTRTVIWTNLWINDSITYSQGQSFERTEWI